MNHFVHCCSFSTSNKITSKGCKSASQTCDFDAKKQFFSREGAQPPTRTPPPVGRGTPRPHASPLGASILIPPILKFCLRYWCSQCIILRFMESTVQSCASKPSVLPRDAMHSVYYAVVRCPTVCLFIRPSVRHFRVLYPNE